MPTVNTVVYYLFHFQELRSMIQWNFYHMPVHERDEEKEAVTLRICFTYLQKTSRSFSAVIQELNPELLVPIALFYLILRGLDTIEDDMTLSAKTKDPLLRNFHKHIEEKGWNYTGNGPDEKDRDLLVDFKVVVEEFLKVKPAYRAIIADITEKMGNGMADYANNAEFKTGVNTIEEYGTYCHYVAGLVGEGLTRLFVESKLANPALLDRPNLQESMGQFLQKTNIIRDVKEDWDDKRRFWPREIWSKYVKNFDDLFDPANQDAALNCSSEMVLNALYHADECLFYLAGIKDQSVFNFAAIPQSMAIATLALVFRNPDIFKRNIKITKGQACRLMIESSQNLIPLMAIFRQQCRIILKKNTNKDPNFLKISIACGKIEKFMESIYPSQNPKVLSTITRAEEKAAEAGRPELTQAQREDRYDTFIMLAIVMGSLMAISTLMIAVAWYFGARFDLAILDMMESFKGNKQPVHNEL